MTSKEFKSHIVPLSSRIYPMAARILSNEEDARDAVQEVMLKLWRKRKQLGSHVNLNGFVFATARNHCLDLLRKKKRNGTDLEIQSNTIYSCQVFNEGHLENKEANKIIKELINDLPDNQREVILLRDVDGLEFDEIVALTGHKIEHLRVWLFRARKRVSKKLTEIYDYENGTGR